MACLNRFQHLLVNQQAHQCLWMSLFIAVLLLPCLSRPGQPDSQYLCGFGCENSVEKTQLVEQAQKHLVPSDQPEPKQLTSLPALSFETGVSVCLCKRRINNRLLGFLMGCFFQASLSFEVASSLLLSWWRLAGGADTPLESKASHYLPGK